MLENRYDSPHGAATPGVTETYPLHKNILKLMIFYLASLQITEPSIEPLIKSVGIQAQVPMQQGSAILASIIINTCASNSSQKAISLYASTALIFAPLLSLTGSFDLPKAVTTTVDITYVIMSMLIIMWLTNHATDGNDECMQKIKKFMEAIEVSAGPLELMYFIVELALSDDTTQLGPLPDYYTLIPTALSLLIAGCIMHHNPEISSSRWVKQKVNFSKRALCNLVLCKTVNAWEDAYGDDSHIKYKAFIEAFSILSLVALIECAKEKIAEGTDRLGHAICTAQKTTMGRSSVTHDTSEQFLSHSGNPEDGDAQEEGVTPYHRLRK